MKLRRNSVLIVLWALLIVYAFLFAPGSMSGSVDLLDEIITDPMGVEPLVFSLFNLMGIWPLLYAMVLLFEGRDGKLKSWPFVLGSFAAGAFSLMIYLGLRKEEREFRGETNAFLKLLDSSLLGLTVKLVAMALLAYGLGAGDLGAYWKLLTTNMFVHVMTLDFIVLTMLFPYVMKDDMHRRGIGNSRAFWLYALLPILGPLSYLWTRPPLPGQD